jgi:phosphatidylinositol-4,5-bisphosphate 3-kinase
MTSSSDSAKGSITAKKVSEPSEMSALSPSSRKPAIATSAIIFKIGDDLRQDMLTLQVIKIVDSIWKQEGLDMCMLAYTCLSTGKNVGIIEVVNRAETITSIQKSGGRMATIQIDSSQLHRWIKERNLDNYDEAIDRFTRSCAGYSVLTFVLGIADRNPDNIMVSEDGRIFHIDFGHFLGHFKRKFGINRERVPFVLTEDFLHVIARGSDVRRGNSFDSFRELCGDAYISLRRHTNLLITLFEMMLKTGIPELKTVEDMSWLTTSLQIGVTEEKAREYFQAQFFEAYFGAWATKVDWFFHNIKRM